uniref:Uncharacterized protein n=1 Tax=Globisporangium ultimum (strain ATCC 200006 / CBS 805.95 / DAOM BR144) TaxID=431595 RepID=K3X2C8_GLOUD
MRLSTKNDQPPPQDSNLLSSGPMSKVFFVTQNLESESYSHGSDIQYMRLSTPVQFADPETVMGIQHVNFSHSEVQDYVVKWISAIACFQSTVSNGSSAMETLCANLGLLTGRYVRFCATAIHALSQVYFSRVKSGSVLPSADEWIRKLHDGSLNEVKDESLAGIDSSCKVLKTINIEQFDRLKRIFVGTRHDDDDVIKLCVQSGILVLNGSQFEFASPVMSFVKMRVGHIVRTCYYLRNLPEMMARVMRAIITAVSVGRLEEVCSAMLL